MAVMHWNENKDNLRRELARRNLPQKGKRARGRSRLLEMEQQRTTWRSAICDLVIKSIFK
jgi:hypothetical protein